VSERVRGRARHLQRFFPLPISKAQVKPDPPIAAGLFQLVPTPRRVWPTSGEPARCGSTAPRRPALFRDVPFNGDEMCRTPALVDQGRRTAADTGKVVRWRRGASTVRARCAPLRTRRLENLLGGIDPVRPSRSARLHRHQLLARHADRAAECLVGMPNVAVGGESTRIRSSGLLDDLRQQTLVPSACGAPHACAAHARDQAARRKHRDE